MKKTKLFLAIAAMPLFMASCVVSSEFTTTGNPVGTKKAFLITKFIGSSDVSLAAAVKKAKITKIGTVDYKTYALGRISIYVTGE